MSIDTESTPQRQPPYLPWATFENTLDRWRQETLPARIDRTTLRGQAGGTQSQFLRALTFLGLIDAQGHPTPILDALVRNTDDRPRILAGLVREAYPEAMALSQNASPGQLEEAFEQAYNVAGETRRKAIAFYLSAARAAEIQLSPHFPSTRPGRGGRTGNGGPRRRTSNRQGAKNQRRDRDETPATSTPSDARGRYIDLLLKKAEEDLDDALLDRIERVIGVAQKDADKE
jgi:Family of unknown function (DUF5343)